eukprot:Rhum_TRINITY_DN14614_c24_g1::Rhum_TRINITY_DN14614_c24_g1_i1::g.104451::m.104451
MSDVPQDSPSSPLAAAAAAIGSERPAASPKAKQSDDDAASIDSGWEGENAATFATFDFGNDEAGLPIVGEAAAAAAAAAAASAAAAGGVTETGPAATAPSASPPAATAVAAAEAEAASSPSVEAAAMRGESTPSAKPSGTLTPTPQYTGDGAAQDYMVTKSPNERRLAPEDACRMAQSWPPRTPGPSAGGLDEPTLDLGGGGGGGGSGRDSPVGRRDSWTSGRDTPTRRTSTPTRERAPTPSGRDTPTRDTLRSDSLDGRRRPRPFARSGDSGVQKQPSAYESWINDNYGNNGSFTKDESYLSDGARGKTGVKKRQGLAQNSSGTASPMQNNLRKQMRSSSASDRLMQPTASFLRKTSRQQ